MFSLYLDLRGSNLVLALKYGISLFLPREKWKIQSETLVGFHTISHKKGCNMLSYNNSPERQPGFIAAQSSISK